MSTVERKFFGTDGIRGLAGTPPLDAYSLVSLGRALAKVFRKEKGRIRVLIAKDTRLSGYMIETAMASGLTSMGAEVMICGPLPTPGLSYLTASMRVDAGIMISASHNSFEDNGIKIFSRDGRKLPDATEREIEELLSSESLRNEVPSPKLIGKATRIEDAVGRYTVFLKNCFARSFTLEGLRIGVDCANGAGYIVGPQTFEELGAEVVARGTSPNGKNINSGFGSLFPEVSRELVSEYNLDFAVALDGDGDRGVIVDEKGGLLDGDAILALCAKDLAERGLLRKSVVVGTVMSNLGLERFLERLSLQFIRSAVGDRYVLEHMEESGAQLGGEQSGHIIFRDYASTGDGILTALRVLEIMCRSGKPLSELLEGYERFPQKLVNIKVRSRPDLSEHPVLSQLLAQKAEEISGSGRLLVRYSGTEPKLRIMVQGESDDFCEKHCGDIAEVVQREIGDV